MSRQRAFIAILLAVTWCSAAWHVDMEAVRMMLDHKHAAHPGHDADHAPIGVPDSDHEQVFSRDVAKDQVRVSQGTLLGFALFGLASWLVATLRLNRAALIGPRQRRETGPPCAHVWQFVRRCAPLSAAPPALR